MGEMMVRPLEETMATLGALGLEGPEALDVLYIGLQGLRQELAKNIKLWPKGERRAGESRLEMFDELLRTLQIMAQRR